MERAKAGEEFLITRRGRPHARLTPPPGFQPALEVVSDRAGLSPAPA
jgi:antitoxin (DNA-binding transcriptional repressor) of toxin-antitoxin stability system